MSATSSREAKTYDPLCDVCGHKRSQHAKFGAKPNHPHYNTKQGDTAPYMFPTSSESYCKEPLCTCVSFSRDRLRETIRPEYARRNEPLLSPTYLPDIAFLSERISGSKRSPSPKTPAKLRSSKSNRKAAISSRNRTITRR